MARCCLSKRGRIAIIFTTALALLSRSPRKGCDGELRFISGTTLAATMTIMERRTLQLVFAIGS